LIYNRILGFIEYDECSGNC